MVSQKSPVQIRKKCAAKPRLGHRLGHRGNSNFMGRLRGACLLDEDLSQARLAEGVVLQVEAVKAVERVLVCVHVQRVHVQVIPAHTPQLLSNHTPPDIF